MAIEVSCNVGDFSGWINSVSIMPKSSQPVDGIADAAPDIKDNGISLDHHVNKPNIDFHIIVQAESPSSRATGPEPSTQVLQIRPRIPASRLRV